MKRSLKVLFWVSPVTEMAWPWQKLPWMRVFIPRISNALKTAGYDVDSTIILSADLKACVEANGIIAEGRLVSLSQAELLDGFRFNALSETVCFQETRENSGFFPHLGRLLLRKLGREYVPDVVISFSPSPFFRDIYPDAVLLYHELGIFSRSPYPETYYFDPFGATSRNFASLFAGEINAVAPEPCFRDELVDFRREITSALISNVIIAGYFSNLRNKFGKLLLVPLGYEGFADGRINFPYQTQLEFVEHILDVVDAGTAVLLTQHPGRRALADDAIAALKVLHPNLLNERFYCDVASFSQVAMAYCDACITQSSTLAYQAAFLGKHLVTVGGFCAGIADGHSVVDLPNIYGKPPINRDNFFVWVIRHHITDLENMPGHLERLIEAWRGGLPKEMSVKSWPEGLSIDEFRQRLREWRASLCPPAFKQEACATVFFDMGAGYSQENACFVLRVCENSIKAKVALPEGCVRARVDLVEGCAILVSQVEATCDGEAVSVASHNGSQTPDGLLFVTNDPQINFDIPSKAGSLEFEMTFRKIPEDEALSLCARERLSLCGELEAIRIEAAAWRTRYDEISSSTCWRMTKPVRWMLDRVKKVMRKQK